MTEKSAAASRVDAGHARSSGRGGAAALALALTTAGAACYGFGGGGGLPSHIRTAYVEPVTNQTSRFGLSEVLTDRLLEATRRRLGLRLAAETEADAVIRATVSRYSDVAVNFEAQEGVGANVFLRRVTVGARVQIYDSIEDRTIWQSAAVNGVGEYEPQNETEEAGLEVAMQNLVQKIVDGAQSQW